MALPLGLIMNMVGSKAGILVILAVVVSAGAYIGVQHFQIKSQQKTISEINTKNNNLIVDNTILKDNNEVLTDNMRKLATANHTNYLTAQQLINERAASQRAINNLASAVKRDGEALDRLSGKVSEMLKDAKSDGPVAPVLREVIREIQKERGVR